MEFGSVYHRTTEQYCYARNEEELVISLLTGYDVKQVFINWGDPFSAGIKREDRTRTSSFMENCVKAKV